MGTLTVKVLNIFFFDNQGLLLYASSTGLSVRLFVFTVKFVITFLVLKPASGALRCGLNNGGCWKETKDGRTYSACIVGSFH